MKFLCITCKSNSDFLWENGSNKIAIKTLLIDHANSDSDIISTQSKTPSETFVNLFTREF